MGKSIKIAVVSDLHCQLGTAERVDSLFHYDAAWQSGRHPIQSLLELIEDKHLVADALLVPGDLSNQMDPTGLNYAWLCIGKLKVALRAEVVAATPGNHDIDSRKRHDDGAFEVARNAFPDFPVPEPEKSDFWGKRFCCVGSSDLRILIVNTVAHHTSIEEALQGDVKDADVRAIGDYLSAAPQVRFQVALFHHNPISHEGLGMAESDIMPGGPSLLRVLDRHRFELAVHGHRHYPCVTYFNSLPVFAAGSLAATPNDWQATRTRNLFHLVGLDDQQVQGCVRQGTISSWEFRYNEGWVEPNFGSADFPPCTGFGCRIPPEELASKTETWLTGKLPQDWDAALQQLPEVAYLTPRDFDRYREVLDQKGIGFMYAAHSDRPVTIGWKVGR